MGVEGTYVRFSDTFDLSLEFDRLKGPEFRVNKYVSSSLKDLTKRVVAIATAYMGLREFLDYQSKREFGMVNQALCASLRENLLKEYSMLVGQLEYQFYNGPGAFSLQQLQLQLMDIGKKLQQGYELGQIILRENAKKSEEAVRSTFDDDLDKVIESLKLNNNSGGRGSGDNGASGGAQPDNGTLNQLLSPTSKSNVCKGGTILRILSRRLTEYSGDPDARQLFTQLLQDASKPYLRMLDLWINKGIILDPHEEFLVREKQGLSKKAADMDYSDEYWDKRYTVRKDDLPIEFDSPQVYERILLTGKYLNVIRECGGAIDEEDSRSSNEFTQYRSISDGRILKSLSKAYTRANRALLDLIIKTHDLPTRLRSLKHYFFLDRADFFINFMDIAERELVKPLAQSGSKSKLQYLLDMALRQPGSLSSNDPFRDEVLVDISNISVTDYLLKIVSVTGMDPNEALGLVKGNDRTEIVERMVHTGPGSTSTHPSGISSTSSASRLTVIQGLQLDFNIPFPLSLVLSRKTILRYQLIFRHLVEIKNIERILKTSWIESQKEGNMWVPEELRDWKLKAANLRAKMNLFIQQILYFCTMEVIEPNWKKFAARNLGSAADGDGLSPTLAPTATVDGLMEQHVFYLDTCMKECMLTNEKLLKLQNKLFSACRLFGEFLLNKGKATVKLLAATENSSGVRPKRPINHKTGLEVSDEELLKYLQNSLKQYENSFDHHVKVLIEALNYYSTTETTVLLNLSHQLQVFFELAWLLLGGLLVLSTAMINSNEINLRNHNDLQKIKKKKKKKAWYVTTINYEVPLLKE